MTLRAAGPSLLLASIASIASIAALGCGGARGAPFGYSAHPYSPQQLERMLSNWPNPGANPEDVVRDALGAIVQPPKDAAAYRTELVTFVPGRPSAIIEASNPREALGAPDYTTNIREPPHAVSLGNGGSIVLHLTGEPLVDGEGPDLIVFEAGPNREAVSIELSADGAEWTRAGEAPGGMSAVDIGPFVKPGEVYRFVKLTDVRDSGFDNDVWPGAEIDAIAVIAPKIVPQLAPPKPPERITIPTEVLFSFDSDSLAPGAPAALDRVVTLLGERPASRLAIEGHTDDIGDDAYNLDLSERRAKAVMTYLVQRGVSASRVEARGLGETRPVSPNDGDDGRRKNRRVELLLQEP